MQPTTNNNEFSPNGDNLNALKQFALDTDVKSKSDEKFGEKVILQVEQIINSGYFSERNIRFATNEAMAAGRMDVTKFMDFFNMNGKTNYIKLIWKSIKLVNTIVGRLVGRWMTKKEKAAVTAVDPISIKQKRDEYEETEFILYNKEKLAQLEGSSGIPLVPPEQFIPDDKDHLDLWAEEEQRTPEEILYEKGINTVFDDNDWGDMGVNTRAVKYDSAVFGLIGAETIADKYGKIQVNKCNPKNMFYSYSERDDFKDAAIKGEIISWKISEIRDKYPKLNIKELWEIAKISKQWTVDNKITFQTSWHTNMFLPIDDWNVDIVRFTLRTIDVDKNLIKTAKDGSLYVDKPKKRIDDVYPGNEYVEKTIWNIYRGVYVRQTKKILEWGLEKNMIKPQNYEKIGEASSPYSFYMYQNRGMRNLAVPEKIEEPVEMMIITRLKIQQLMATMHAAGYMYDIDGLQEMDLGNGICSPLELKKVTDQTGNIYYRSRDTEGNRIDKPVTENPNSAGISKMQELIETYNFHAQVVRDEIGSNEIAEGQTIKPRTGIQNAQTSLEISFNATDYMNDACVALKDEIADNIACLLHDSVEFGSNAYRKLMKEEDVKQREFKVKIEMLPTTEEITNLDNTINNALAVQPDLVLYLNPEKIKRIARKNVKLAELYFRQGQKRAIKGRMEKAEQDSRMNMENQIASNKSAAEGAESLQKQKLAADKEMKEYEAMQQIKVKIVEGSFAIAAKSENPQMPEWLMPIIQQLLPNIVLPLANENKQIGTAIMMQEQQEQEQMEQQQQAMEQGQPEMMAQ